MEAQHALTNPWSFQQHPHCEDGGEKHEDPVSDPQPQARLSRRSNDHRHYSFASTTTISPDPPYHDMMYENDKQSSQQQRPHDRTWSYDDTIASLEHDETDKADQHLHGHVASLLTFSLDQEVSSDPFTALSESNSSETSQTDESLELTSADYGVGLLEGDVLEHQVQKLQSEVADTRAIVFDLESRLNAAESSNKYIVEELKMLLADTEGTLVGSDDSDSGDSFVAGSKHGSGSDEDPNVVYNRICHALQILISEAQTALVRNTTTSPLPLDLSCQSSCRTSRRNSVNPTWLRKRLMHVLTGSLEIMLILWVILKLSEVSMKWIGIRMMKGGPQAWLMYIYGDRDGAGSAAKELYEKIRRDGLRLRQMETWRQKESELLMQDFIASEATSGIPRTPFTPAGMIWAPAKRMIAHAVSGVVLAYLSDRARSIARKL
ncbi:hypothetical protein BGX28_006947 [Mortierella sp. GBA30]|nr:hypothetical protein BGX28_006947 [Mortierella sp. GBA30]